MDDHTCNVLAAAGFLAERAVRELMDATGEHSRTVAYSALAAAASQALLDGTEWEIERATRVETSQPELRIVTSLHPLT